MRQPFSQRIRARGAVASSRLNLCWARLFAQPDKRDRFIAYMVQVYHYVRFACPAMRMVVERLPPKANGLRHYLLRHIEEENGHDDWVLEDLAKLGIVRERVRVSLPLRETMAFVGTQSYIIEQVSPIVYFGYMYALESHVTAPDGVRRISEELNIPLAALFTFTEHAAIDPAHHVADLEALLDREIIDRWTQDLVAWNYRLTLELLSDIALTLAIETDVAALLAPLRAEPEPVSGA